MDRNAPAKIQVSNRRGTGRPRVAAALALAAAVLSGCAQPGPMTRRTGLLGALKANVAQLESEKDKLARELAEQKAENRRVEAQLAEIESQNGDLAARLDDARAVMSRQGIDAGRTYSSRAASDDDRGSRRSTPAKVQPKGRKSPFTQIPSERRPLDDSEDEDPPYDSRSVRDERDDLGRQDDRSPWLPVARGKSAPIRVR